jgi:uncharacterized protein
VALAAGLVGFSNVIDPRLPAGVQPVARAALGTALADRARAPLGVRPPQLWSGLRVGLAVAVPVFLGVGASTVASPVRSAMAGRDLPASPSKWLAVRIPVGTVWAEETAYRAALATVAAEAFGPSGGRLLQSLAFGLSHVADARGTGAPVAPTVLVTAVAGWAFALLRERSGSLIAPMLAHLAINEAGAVAAIAIQRSR